MTETTVQRSTAKSPVHIHLEDSAVPVHVHVEKRKKPTQPSAELLSKLDSQIETPSERLTSRSNMRRSTVSMRSAATNRSKTRLNNNSNRGWKSSTKSSLPGMKYSWQGSQYRLDIAPPTAEAEDLPLDRRTANDETEDVLNKVNEYQQKLHDLSSEVDCLKSEVEHKRTKTKLAQTEELLESSYRALQERESDLEEALHERDFTESDNRRLRQHVDNHYGDVVGVTSPSSEICSPEIESLMKKLVEAEVDAQAIADKAVTFTDAIQRLREDKRLTAADSAAILSKHIDALGDSIEQFAVTNSALRYQLRDLRDHVLSNPRLSEQRDSLLSKLARAQDAVQVFKKEAIEKDRAIADLQLQLNAQKDENVTVSSLQASLNLTRAHLQKQLKQKDGDCNRMAVQIRTLESQLTQEKIEVDHLRSLLQRAKEKTDEDKEALKKATRVLKVRATKSKDELEQMHVQLLDREAVIADQRVEIDTVRSMHAKVGREKAQMEAELSALRIRIGELESVMDRTEDDTKLQISQLAARLQDKSTELASVRLDNDRLKMSLASLEEKLSLSEADMIQLRANLREYETLVDEYRKQLNHSRQEADDSICQLEEQKRHAYRARQNTERELDQVKEQLESRLRELEPFPELLQSTEMKLRDAGELLREYEKRHVDNVKLIGDLTTKLESHATQLQDTRQKSQLIQDESRATTIKLEILEKKLAAVEEQNRELVSTNAKKEEALHQLTTRLEEKTANNASLQRQLDAAVSDIKRQKELEREHISASERTLQTRLLDLESQLSQARAEISRQKREKNEVERSLNSRLDDLKSRLEASHSTNRTMQNYVHFLKGAYANAFNDSTLAINASPPRTTLF